MKISLIPSVRLSILIIAFVFVAGCYSSYDSHLFLANRYYEAGEYKRAADEYRSAILSDPKNGTAYYFLAECFLAAGQEQDALFAFEKVIEVDPQLAADAAHQLATLYLQSNKLDTANYYCLKALSEKSTLIEAYATYGNIQNGMGNFEKAIEFVNRGLSQRRRMYGEHGVRDYLDTRASLYNTLGKAYAGLGKWQTAAAVFDSAAQYAPQWHMPWYNKAELFESLGKFSRAQEIYTAAIRKGWNVRELYPRAARMYFLWGRVQRSLQLLEQLQHSTVDDLDVLITLGRLYEYVDRPTDAQVIYHLAMLVDTLAAAPHYYLGRFFAADSQYSVAKEHLEQAMKLEPTYPGSFLHAGLRLYRRGDYTAAEAMFSRVIALDSLCGEAYLNLAMLSLMRNQTAAASQLFFSAQDRILRYGLMPDSKEELEMLFTRLIQNE